MNKILTTLVLLTLVHISNLTASAQRTMSGQFSLSISAHYNGSFLGAEAFLSQYTLNGYWEVGVNGDAFRTLRLVGTRSRSLNLYAGGGAFAGIEAIDPKRRLPSYLDTGLKDISFLYGLYAKGLTELFIGRKVSLTTACGLNVYFSSAIAKLHPCYEIGIKILL